MPKKTEAVEIVAYVTPSSLGVKGAEAIVTVDSAAQVSGETKVDYSKDVILNVSSDERSNDYAIRVSQTVDRSQLDGLIANEDSITHLDVFQISDFSELLMDRSMFDQDIWVGCLPARTCKPCSTVRAVSIKISLVGTSQTFRTCRRCSCMPVSLTGISQLLDGAITRAPRNIIWSFIVWWRNCRAEAR